MCSFYLRIVSKCQRLKLSSTVIMVWHQQKPSKCLLLSMTIKYSSFKTNLWKSWDKVMQILEPHQIWETAGKRELYLSQTRSRIAKIRWYRALPKWFHSLLIAIIIECLSLMLSNKSLHQGLRKIIRYVIVTFIHRMRLRSCLLPSLIQRRRKSHKMIRTN